MIDVDWDRLYYKCCIWVELPVQRRLCPIFVRNAGSPDIHECFRGLTGSQRTSGIRGVTGARMVSGFAVVEIKKHRLRPLLELGKGTATKKEH